MAEEQQLISNKYEILRQLGVGGMGMVFLVRHTTLDREVALKVLPPNFLDSPELLTRFRFEAQLMAQLKHPGIVGVIDFDQDPERGLYYTMDYIEGKTLGQHLRARGAFPLPEVLAIARQSAQALAYAHTRQPAIIHRDISPSNIMIRQSDSSVVVMDFGIAKVMGGEGLTVGPAQGGWMGKPKYCSPEQMRQEDLDGQADIYSLGMVMYELCTGQQFFAGVSTDEVIKWVRDDPRENEPEFPAQVPASFAEIVRKAIAKSRQRRYRDMADLLRDLAACEPGQHDDATLVGDVTLIQETSPLIDPEEELEYRRALRAKEDAQEAYELAKRADADTWAAALFAQGTQRIQKADTHFEAREYDTARITAQEAGALFDQAREQARIAAEAARQHEEQACQAAEHAQHEMHTAKAQAEHENARESAPRLYTQGLRLQRRGEVQFEAKAYEQAAQEYANARIAFADAGALAHDERRNEVEALQAQVRERKAAAVDVQAAALAGATFQDAADQEQQANAAWQQDDLTLAGRFYTAAHEQFQRAHDQAQTEQDRHQAVALQERISQAQERGTALGISQYASSPAQHADAEQARGNAAFEAAAYTQATAHYRTALDHYAQAIQDTQHALTQLAETARQAMQAAREAAEEAGARERYGSEFAAIEASLGQAQACEAEQGYLEALRLYSTAEKEFETLKQRAEHAEIRERAAAARVLLQTVQTQGAELRVWAQAAWEQAEQTARQAETAWEEEDYAQAKQLSDVATEAYEQAVEQAQRERLIEQARQSGQQAGAARREADAAQAQAYAAEAYARATEVQAQAEQSVKAEQYRQATTLFQEAQAVFRQTAETARQEQARQRAIAQAHADTAHEQMRAVREQVTALREWAEDRWAAAQAEEHRAERAYKEENYSHAQACCEQARRLYTQVGEEGQTRRFRVETGQAATAVSTVQRLAEHAQAQEYAPSLYTEGHAAYTTARQASKAEQWQTAIASYQRAQTCFAQAAQAAQTERARLAAAESYAGVEKAQAAARQARDRFPADYQQIQALVMQGQQHEADQAYTEAQEAYDRAVQQFAMLQQRAEQAAGQEKAEAALERLQQQHHHSTGLRAWAQTAWTQADQVAAQAQAAWQRADYRQAESLAEQARRSYAQAETLARTERLVEQAGQAGQQVLVARQAAETAGAPHYATAAYERAVAAQARAEDELETGAYEPAQKLFRDAQALFETATRAAQHEQARLHTAEIAGQVDVAREAAEQAGALERYAAEFGTITALVQQGREREAEQAYAEAQQLYHTAQDQFIALQHRAEQAAAQENSGSQREQAAVVREQAAELQQWAPTQWAEAEAAATQAQQAYQAEAYPQAAQLFQTAQALFERVQGEGEAARLQAEAHQRGEAARAARTAAEAEQAAIYASEVFQDGHIASREAERQEGAADWPSAIAGYHQAHQLFTTAAEQARVEQARQAAAGAQAEAEAAQKTAEEAGAKDRYQTVFGKALLLVRQGQEQVVAEAYPEAQQRFVEAQHQFITLKEQAEAALDQERAKAARDLLAAVQGQNKALRAWAVSAWQQAAQTAQQAEAAWTQSDYPRAETLYEQALQTYAQAAGQAKLEQLRDQAEQAEQDTRLTQQQAEATSAPDDAPAAYRRAADVQAQARQQFAAQAYDAAVALFQEAGTLFEAAAQAAQHEQARRAATAAYGAAQTACTAAQNVGAPDRYHPEFTVAERLLQHGQKSAEAEAFAEARADYQAAQQQFEVLRQQTERDRAREQVQAVQKKMLVARGSATELREWAAQRWAEAQEQERAGEHAYRQEDYPQATASCEAASALYEKVRTEGEAAQLRAEAEQAAGAAGQARQLAEEAGVGTYAAELFAESEETYRRAHEQVSAEHWQAARTAYHQAQEMFTATAAAAYQEHARQEAVGASESAQQARSAAEQVGAHVRYPEAFGAAQAAVEQGQVSSLQETQEAYAQAQQHYTQARQQYETLRQRAEQATAAEQVEAARQQLAPLREAAQALAPEWEPELWTQAQDLESQADTAWQAEMYSEARMLYRQAAQQYQLAHGEAAARHRQHRTQRERAQQAGALAREAQHAAAEFSGRRKVQAERLLAEGDRLFAQQTYAEAEAQYEQATKLFEAVCRPKPAWQRALLPAAAVFVFAIGATLLYRSRPAPPPNQLPAISRVEPIPETGQPIVVSATTPNLFRVEATDPDTADQLQYTWFLDETQVQVASGPSWTFDAGFPTGELTIADPQPAAQQVSVAMGDTRRFAVQATLQPSVTQHRQVRVEVVDSHGATVQQHWEIDVQPLRVEPRELEYVWYLDSQEVARGQTWEFHATASGGEIVIAQPQPPAQEVRVESGKEQIFSVQAIVRGLEPEQRQVMVKISSPSGAERHQTWDLTVQPSGSGNLDKRDLVYTWFMDGQEVARGKTWSLQTPPTSSAAGKLALSAAAPKSRQVLVQAGRAQEFWAQAGLQNGTRQTPQADLRKQVMVQVADPSGVRDQRTWDVTVVPTTKAEQDDRFQYVWYLDGKESARTPRWVFQAPEISAKLALLNPQPARDRVRLTAGTSQLFSIQASLQTDTPKQQRVMVQISSPHGTTVRRDWEVTVQPQAIKQDKQNTLRYSWFLDGRKIATATDQSWPFTAPIPDWELRLDNPRPGNARVVVEPGASRQFSVQGKIRGQGQATREVRVEVTDPRGKKEQRTWTVSVQELPPQELRYEWTVNQATPQTSQNGAFTFSGSGRQPGTYQLAAVAIGPDGLRSTPQNWTINIPPPEKTLTPITITKQDVQKWLADYQQAWAAKDTKRLVDMGEYSQETAAQASQVLAQYLEYRVDFTNIDIQIDKNQAVVKTKRVDTVTSEQRGILGSRSQKTETLEHPGSTTFVLRKDNGKIKRAR